MTVPQKQFLYFIQNSLLFKTSMQFKLIIYFTAISK